MKINPNEIDDLEPTPRVVKFTKSSKVNKKRDAKRAKRSKRGDRHWNMHKEVKYDISNEESLSNS